MGPGPGSGDHRLRAADLPLQGAPYRVIHRVKGPFFTDELHLGLGGVDVHIHAVEPGVHVEDAAGKLPYHVLVAVGLLQGGHQRAGFDEAPVDKKILTAPGAPAAGREGGEALHSDAILPGALYLRKAQRQVPSQDRVNGRAELSVPGGEQLLFPIPEETHGHLGVGQRLPLDGGENGGPLGGVLFHILEAGWSIVKEVPHHHGGALGTAGLLPARNRASLQREGDAEIPLRRPGEHLHPGHGGDGGQSLSPESQGADGLQVVLRADLAGGVAEEGRLHVAGFHAAAVVGDTDIGHAAVLDLHREGGRSGVDGVFHQLLYHGGGTFHHLAGGNEVGNVGFQYLNAGHCATTFLRAFLKQASPSCAACAVDLSPPPGRGKRR